MMMLRASPPPTTAETTRCGKLGFLSAHFRRKRHRSSLLRSVSASSSSSSSSSPFGVVLHSPIDDDETHHLVVVVESMIEATMASARLAKKVDENRDVFLGVVERKEDQSLVTVADFAIQTLMSERLRSLGDVVGEERLPKEGETFDRVQELVAKFASREEEIVSDDGENNNGEVFPDYGEKRNYFVLDPIDGTKAFATVEEKKGRYKFTEQYCVGLSYHDGKTGDVLASCLAAPRWERGSGVILVAVKGKGCFSKEMFAEPEARWKRCCLMTHLSPIRVAVSESDVGKATTLNAGWKVPKSSLDEIAYGSGSLIKYVAIAVNACDSFVHYKPWTFSMNVWDHASGVLCCEEAGAIVTDGFGNTLKLRKEPRQTEEMFDERGDVDLRRTFSPKGKAVVVANEESLHKEILRAHNAGVEQINDFSAGLGR
jgi:3'-phosphoadenosine 5'-phosphosulfate (PAPS) 3'-phosphatase